MELVFYILGLLTGWLIFHKFPNVYGLISDVAVVVWSNIVFYYGKIKKLIDRKGS